MRNLLSPASHSLRGCCLSFTGLLQLHFLAKMIFIHFCCIHRQSFANRLLEWRFLYMSEKHLLAMTPGQIPPG